MSKISDYGSRWWYRLFVVVYIFAYVFVILTTISFYLYNRPYQVVSREKSYITCPWGNVSLKEAGFDGSELGPDQTEFSAYDDQKADEACAGLAYTTHLEFKTVGSTGKNVGQTVLCFLSLSLVLELIAYTIMYVFTGLKLKQMRTFLGRIAW